MRGAGPLRATDGGPGRLGRRGTGTVSDHAVQVLLVEDNAADVRLTQEVFREAAMHNELHIARDGVEALDFLHQRPPFAAAVRPDMVILDLNMPRKDGREVLADIKGDASLRSIPVAVLTTSTMEADVVESYRLGANCFLNKPVDLDAFVSLVQAIDDFWLGMARLPPTGGADPEPAPGP